MERKWKRQTKRVMREDEESKQRKRVGGRKEQE